MFGKTIFPETAENAGRSRDRENKHGGAPDAPGPRRRVWREKRNEREMSSLEDENSITGKYEENPEFI